MGDCVFCGKPAGIFRTKHKECEEQHLERERLVQDGKLQIIGEVSSAIRSGTPHEDLESTISQIETSVSIPASERRLLLVKGWQETVEGFLEDGVLDEKEETHLTDFKERYDLSQDELDGDGRHALTKMVKASVLREVLNGVIPQRAKVRDDLPINFQKNERMVWAFPGSDYLEDKTRREYVGRSQGVSFRVMKGVYYRVGAFKGHAVERTERTFVDTGWVVITDKHVYFAGPSKSLRIPYSKVVSFMPFDDGFGVIRDTQTAKPQIFVTGDGWFSYNLVTNLAQI